MDNLITQSVISFATFTWVSFLLAVAATVLAITSLVLGWAFFRTSTKMQIEAQRILEKVTQKVDVIVSKTAQQMDKAWDYFTATKSQMDIEPSKEVKKLEDALREKLLQDARREVEDAMKNAGLDKDTISNLTSRVQSVVNRSAEDSRMFYYRTRFVTAFKETEASIRKFADFVGTQSPSDHPIETVFESLKGHLPSRAAEDFRDILDLKRRIVEGDAQVQARDMLEHRRKAQRLRDFLDALSGQRERESDDE